MSILSVTVFITVENEIELVLMDENEGKEVMRQAAFAVASGALGLTVQKEDVVCVDLHANHDKYGCEHGCLPNMYRDENGEVTR